MGPRIRAILNEDLGQPGFATIRRRLVDTINSTRLSRLLELLGREIHNRIDVHIGGSIPTLIKGLTVRPTIDIDFVDEVPAEIRRQRAVLRKIETDFGLKLTHMRSHFLPAHWHDRRHWFGDFGGLRVYVVDEYDVFVSKLSSKQEKHQSDLGVLALKLNKDTAKHRLLTDGQAFLDDRKLRPQIEENWRFIFQEPLFPEDAGRRKRQGPSSGSLQKPSPPRRGRGKRRGPRMSTDH
jgi:hypothetical protein